MEESRNPSTGMHRPLFSQGDTPHQGVESAAGPGLNSPSQPPPSQPEHALHEADIADSDGLHEEKHEPISPTRQPGEATPIEEAQALDWIVPVQNGFPTEKRRTVGERLASTLLVAKEEQAKYAKRASLASLSINGAMFAQIVVNALVTGLSALQNNRNAQIGVSALGAIGTILASFMVRVRGTREPERSVSHSQNLERFIRQLEAFILDNEYSRDPKLDSEVKRFRVEFDKLQSAAHQSENGQPMA